MSILIDKQYNWKYLESDGLECWYIGNKGAVEKFISVIKNKKDISQEEINTIINNLVGNFAFIVKENERCIAVVDKIRSYPIFYFIKIGEINIIYILENISSKVCIC